MKKPLISVVIPSHNAEPVLWQQLDALVEQDTDVEFEIIVADNGSSDDTRGFVARRAAEDPCIRYVDASSVVGINHARNRGAEAALGELILFCDADDVVQPGWLRAHAEHFKRSEATLFGGGLIRTFGGDVSSRTQLITSLWSLPFPSGANCGLRSEAFRRLGGFDESWRGGGDEASYFWRAQLAGERLSFVEGAWVEYAQRTSARSAWKQQWNYGKSNARLYREFREHGMPRSSSISALVGIAKALARLLSPGAAQRTGAIGSLALHAGRAWGSVRHRVIYL